MINEVIEKTIEVLKQQKHFDALTGKQFENNIEIYYKIIDFNHENFKFELVVLSTLNLNNVNTQITKEIIRLTQIEKLQIGFKLTSRKREAQIQTAEEFDIESLRQDWNDDVDRARRNMYVLLVTGKFKPTRKQNKFRFISK